jgi:hypothetical protein
LIIHVADPNRPVYEDAEVKNPHEFTIRINKATEEFSFLLGATEEWTGRNGVFKGGRMFPVSYSKLSQIPRTPYYEVGVALLALVLAVVFIPVGILGLITGGIIIVFGNNTEANQITDGQDRTYFTGEGDVNETPNERIPNLTHISNRGAMGDFEDVPNVFYAKTPRNFEPMELPEAQDSILENDTWSYSHLSTAIFSKNFALDINEENFSESFSEKMVERILGSIPALPAAEVLSFDMANKGFRDYDWAIATRHSKIVLTTNPIEGNQDKITIDGLNRSGQAVTFMASDAQENKRLKATITSPCNHNTFELENINIIAGQPVSFQHNNGGKQVLVHNTGNSTQIDVHFSSVSAGIRSFSLIGTDLPKNCITSFEATSDNSLEIAVHEQIGSDPISTTNLSNIKIDCTGLLNEWLFLASALDSSAQKCTNPPINLPVSPDWFYCYNRVSDFVVQDGTYFMVVQSGALSIIRFKVAAGIIEYDPMLEGIISGAGTNKLHIIGVPVTIDAREVKNHLVYLPGVYGLDSFETSRASRPFETGNFVPTSHDGTDGWTYSFNIASGQVSTFNFKVVMDGSVNYEAEFDNSVQGRGTNVLKIKEFFPR